MTITNDFVFIHFPKNAGSFVTKCLKELYDNTADKSRKRKVTDYLVYLTDREKTNYCLHYRSKALEYNGKRIRSQHQGCIEIPEKHREKPIVSIIRNPYDRYVSLYKYGWWKKKNNVDKRIINEKFPTFPDLTFKQYMDFLFNYHFTELKKRLDTRLNIGPYSLGYIKLFAKNYTQLLASDQLPEVADKNFYTATFLKTENINTDLYEFLKKMGWPPDAIAFILKKGRVNISRESHSYREYYDQELIDLITEKDALLFKLFPEYTF